MKKVLLIAGATLMLFASCRKVRTCTCTDNVGNSSTETYPAVSKSVAKADCEQNEAYYTTYSPSSGITCKVD